MDKLAECQKAFEDWYTDGILDCPSIDQNADGYKLMQTKQSWVAWQAGWLSRNAE